MDATPSLISPRTPNEIICDVLYCLEREDTAQCQMVCQEWNNLIVSLKNLLPTRYFNVLWFLKEEIRLYRASFGDLPEFRLYVNGTNVDNWTNARVNVKQKYQDRLAQEVIQYLKDAEYGNIDINYMNTKEMLKILKDVSTITEGPIKAKRSNCQAQRLDDFLLEIYENYIHTDHLYLTKGCEHYIREICANPQIVRLPSTPKEIVLGITYLKGEEALQFTGDGKLNGANRVTLRFITSPESDGSFCRKWFDLYSCHGDPLLLVGKFEFEVRRYGGNQGLVLVEATKRFLKEKGNKRSVKYSLTRNGRLLKRFCLVYATNSYGLIIEIDYLVEIDVKEIVDSNLEQPEFNQMTKISFGVKKF